MGLKIPPAEIHNPQSSDGNKSGGANVFLKRNYFWFTQSPRRSWESGSRPWGEFSKTSPWKSLTYKSKAWDLPKNWSLSSWLWKINRNDSKHGIAVLIGWGDGLGYLEGQIEAGVKSKCIRHLPPHSGYRILHSPTSKGNEIVILVPLDGLVSISALLWSSSGLSNQCGILSPPHLFTFLSPSPSNSFFSPFCLDPLLSLRLSWLKRSLHQ